MVKKLSIFALICFFAFTSASESGTLATRAKKSINTGKYAKAYNQLERALLASRKESDLLSEARILIAMAQIRTQSLDLDFADSLISIVRPQILDKSTQVNFIHTKVALENAKNNFSKSESLCNKTDLELIKKVDEPARASFFAECAIGYAGARKADLSQDYLIKVGKNSDRKGGFYTYTAAQVADLENRSKEADSLYRYAELKSIENNKPYLTATILYKRSQLKTTSQNESNDLKLRCKNAFELMGLPNNSKKCAE